MAVTAVAEEELTGDRLIGGNYDGGLVLGMKLGSSPDVTYAYDARRFEWFFKD